MNLIRIVVSLALAVSATVLGLPSHAATPTGCAADPTLEQRVLVKRKAVITRDGERFGVIRFFAGLRPDRSGIDSPRFCLDLVVAGQFRGDHPKYTASVTTAEYAGSSNGRAHTGRLDGGNTVADAGAGISVSFRTYRPDASATMKLTFPDLG